MRYACEFELYYGAEQWIISAYDLPGAVTQGETKADACESAADLLHEIVADSLIQGSELPPQAFGHSPREGAVTVIVMAEATLADVPRMSAANAAKELGVTPGRITAMIKSGLLDGWREGRNTWVTSASVEARKRDPHPTGRPKKPQVASV